VAEQHVRTAEHDAGRGDHIAARGLEVEVMRGQPPALLAGSGVVGVQAAAAGADQRTGAGEQPRPLEPSERGEPVAVLVPVDVEHVRAGCPGRYGDIGVRPARPPCPDLCGVGGGILEPAAGERRLVIRRRGAVRRAGNTGQPVAAYRSAAASSSHAASSPVTLVLTSSPSL